MIGGLNRILAESGQPGLPELRGLLEELLGGPESSGGLLEQQTLQPRGMRVFRLRFSVDGRERSLIIKRLRPEIARRNQLVAQRWLPAVQLPDAGPPVRGSVAAANGACVWQVYDDLGHWELDAHQPDRDSVRVATELIARMHTRFAAHALLGEVRLDGGDLGVHFFEANVRDALRALEALDAHESRRPLRESLLGRLGKLLEEQPQRAQAIAQWGGPETLLHGDLWAINIFVMPTAKGLCARFIDWDHAAVGPPSYDLSTFLLRFPPGHRPWVLDFYRAAVAKAGWQLPGEPELNFLFETHEYARFANRIIWPALALVQDRAEWGYDALAEVEEWFEQFQPVLPVSAAMAA